MAFASGANIVLTPHILRPGPCHVDERALLRTGSFNAGFLAVRATDETRGFLGWWCEQTKTGCTHDRTEGTYGDQKWLDLAPSVLRRRHDPEASGI